MTLIIKDMVVSIDGNKILDGISLDVKPGETVALMGPNGSGKTTLAHVIMGNPEYDIDSGSITYDGKDITNMETEERSQLGLFLSFQHPVEIPGLVVKDYLREIVQTHRQEKVKYLDFKKELHETMERLGVEKEFADRYLNQGFSGGEKKRMEILQMALLHPKMIVLDETDSGLDIDALQAVSNGVNDLQDENTGILIITHYRRILDHIKPDRVVVMIDGKVVHEGGPELVDRLEAEGYTWMKDE